MGTRGITKVIVDGTVAVAQYGQWDHYPSGQGVNVHAFLQDPDNVAKLRAGLQNVWYPSEDELKAISRPYVNERDMMTMDMGDKFSADYPSLTRDTGAGILEVIANAKGLVPLVKDEAFEEDTLFCEGAYTIDLDKETFSTKWDGKTFTFSFAEIRSMTPEDYIRGCNDEVVAV